MQIFTKGISGLLKLCVRVAPMIWNEGEISETE
jgi:hypothetical protein